MTLLRAISAVALAVTFSACGDERQAAQRTPSATQPETTPSATPSPAGSPSPTIEGSAGWRASAGVAGNREAQDALRRTVISAKVLFTDHETYEDATAQALTDVEAEIAGDEGRPPEDTYVDADRSSTGPNVVSVNPSSATAFYAAAIGADRCFLIRDIVGPGGGTHYATTDGECRATAEAKFYRSP